jgi:O-antigen/teichoic acid export membrane protein
MALVARFSAVPWLLMAQLGTTATGIFAACETVIQLANPLLIAVANIMVPNAAKAFADGGASEVRRIVLRSTVVLGLVTGLLSAAFMLLGGFFVVTVFGEAYLGRGVVIAVLGAGVVAEGLGLSAANGLWAIDQPKANLVANVLAVTCTLVITIVMLNSWGIVGAACGATAGRMAASAVQIFTFLKATETSRTLEVAS